MIYRLDRVYNRATVVTRPSDYERAFFFSLFFYTYTFRPKENSIVSRRNRRARDGAHMPRRSRVNLR